MGPLHGFPYAVKDLALVKGIRTTFGSPILKDFFPTTDSIMVERSVTRNAYDQTRSAGGSSGGAAVSLALRMLPVTDGSDYGGSLRNPAGWNNVFGFRTSYGLVPSDARDVWLQSMGVIGPMARTVADLAMLLSIQAGYDARLPLSMDGDGTRFQEPLKIDLKGKRIAWAGDFKGYLPFEPGVLDVCKAALKTFESMGCIVEEAQPNYPIVRSGEHGCNCVPGRPAGLFSPFTMIQRNER
jgi:amidase